VSGMRATSKVAIFIDVGRAMEDGIEFFESDNGVILSSGIDGVIAPQYFKSVTFL
jgi:2'-phosphotransferase